MIPGTRARVEPDKYFRAPIIGQKRCIVSGPAKYDWEMGVLTNAPLMIRLHDTEFCADHGSETPKTMEKHLLVMGTFDDSLENDHKFFWGLLMNSGDVAAVRNNNPTHSTFSDINTSHLVQFVGGQYRTRANQGLYRGWIVSCDYTPEGIAKIFVRATGQHT